MYENKTLEKYINEKHRANRLTKEIENLKKTIDRNKRELSLQKELFYYQTEQLIKLVHQYSHKHYFLHGYCQ